LIIYSGPFSPKEGVYRKKFFLWPIFFSESLKLNTDNPKEVRAAWPFYISKDSPKRSSTTILWPFFSKVENREKDYVVWNTPWPLVRVTKGDKYHEEMNSELIMRRRDRVLFFLYSDVREIKYETGDSLRRIDFWPFFGYKNTNGVSHPR
jgi:hypothetical protein